MISYTMPCPHCGTMLDEHGEEVGPCSVKAEPHSHPHFDGDCRDRLSAALKAERSAHDKTRTLLRIDQGVLAKEMARVSGLTELLREARTAIDTMNGNIQGQDRAEVRDALTNAVCGDILARIDAALVAGEER